MALWRCSGAKSFLGPAPWKTKKPTDQPELKARAIATQTVAAAILAEEERLDLCPVKNRPWSCHCLASPPRRSERSPRTRRSISSTIGRTTSIG